MGSEGTELVAQPKKGDVFLSENGNKRKCSGCGTSMSPSLGCQWSLLPPPLVVRAKSDDQAAGGIGLGSPSLPCPGHRVASPSAPRGGAVAQQRPGALRGRGGGRRGGRGEGGRQEDLCTSASRWLAGCFWRRRRERRERAARGPAFPSPLRPTRPGPWISGGGLRDEST